MSYHGGSGNLRFADQGAGRLRWVATSEDCPGCGAPPEDMGVIACSYCGRRNGTARFEALIAAERKARGATLARYGTADGPQSTPPIGEQQVRHGRVWTWAGEEGWVAFAADAPAPKPFPTWRAVYVDGAPAPALLKAVDHFIDSFLVFALMMIVCLGILFVTMFGLPPELYALIPGWLVWGTGLSLAAGAVAFRPWR